MDRPGSLLRRITELAQDVRPAAREADDGAEFVGPDGLVRGSTVAAVTVADEIALEVAQKLGERSAVASRRESVHDAAHVRIDEGPQACLEVLLPAAALALHGCVVELHHRARADLPHQAVDDRCQQLRGSERPVALRLARQPHAVALEDALLPVER